MAPFKLCKNEPIIDIIRNLFGANPVRIPEERIQPLCLVGATDGRSSFLGGISAVVTEPKDFTALLKTSTMADVSGKESRKVSLDIGLNILEGFLKGFGIPAGGIGEITTAFKGANAVSFSFGNVQRRYIEPVMLGDLLKDVQIVVANPALAPYVGSPDGRQLLIIDSVITSNDFSMKAEKSGSQEFKLNVPAIQEALGKLNLGVTAESLSSTDVTFKGEKQLAFAFSCLEIAVTKKGKVTSLESDPTERNFGLEATLSASVMLPEEKTMLTESDELLEWE